MKYKIFSCFLLFIFFSFSCEKKKNMSFFNLFTLLNETKKKISKPKQIKTEEKEDKKEKKTEKEEEQKQDDIEKDYPFKNYQIPKNTEKLSNGIPILNSDPNAVAQIYLDFTGGTPKKYSNMKGLDLDGNPNTFNDQEGEFIYQYWVEIHSIFSMFDVNVTTKLDTTKTRAWILITPSLKDSAAAEHSSYNMFSHATGTAALNWTAQGTGTAHEIGHIFGRPHAIRLDTQGNTVQGYINTSNFLRSSLMGAGGKTQTKWHNQYHHNNQFKYSGDIESITGYIKWRVESYLKCANGQYNFCPGRKKNSYPSVSDVHAKVLRNTDGYRPDDHQNIFESATLLSKNSDGKWTKTGILEKHEDIDMFAFNWEGGNMILRTGSVALSPISLKISLFNSSKQIIAGVDKQINHQFLNLKLPAGKYYLKLESRGFYSDIGLYQIHIQKTENKWIAGYLGNLRNIEAIDFEDNEKKITMKGTPSFLWNDRSKNVSYDMMLYAVRKLSGDGSIKAKINPKKWTNKSRFGVMIRKSMDPQAIFAAAIVGEKNYGGRLYYRLNSKGIATEKKKMNDLPQWVKVTRKGTNFTISFSKDNINWINETIVVNMQNQVYIGLFDSAQNGTIMNKVVFDKIETTGNFFDSDLREELTDPNLIVNSTSSITINAGGNYDIERSKDGSSFEKITTNRNYTDVGLQAGSRYFYRTRSINRISPVSFATTIPGTVSNLRFVTFYPRTAKRINLSVVDSVRKPTGQQRGNFTVRLAVFLDWEEESFGSTGYRVRRYASDGTLTWSQDIPQRRRKFVDLDVDFNTQYQYTVTSLYDGIAKKEGSMVSVSGTTPIQR